MQFGHSPTGNSLYVPDWQAMVDDGKKCILHITHGMFSEIRLAVSLNHNDAEVQLWFQTQSSRMECDHYLLCISCGESRDESFVTNLNMPEFDIGT